MTTPRNMRGFDGGGGFGLMRPPPVTLWLMGVSAVVSILVMAAQGWAETDLPARLVLFSPSNVLDSFRIWTAFTWLVAVPTPTGLLWHEVALFFFASSLERQWGGRALLRFVIGSVTGGAILTVLLAAVVPPLRLAGFMDGAWAVGAVLVVGFVLTNWNAQVLLYVIPVPAPFLLALTVGLPLLYVIGGVWKPFVPMFLAMGLAFVMVRGLRGSLSPRRAIVQFRAWWIDRQLRRKARHLRVVPPSERDESGPNKYLH